MKALARFGKALSLTLSAAMSSQVVLRRLVKKSKTGKWGNASCQITAVTSAAFVRPVNKVIFCVVQKK